MPLVYKMINFPAFCESRGSIALFKIACNVFCNEPDDANPNFPKAPNINV